MPKKIQRYSPSTATTAGISDRGAAILAVGHVTAETVKAGAEVYKATANLISTTVQSLAECGKAYFNYLEECQRTQQIQIWSATVIAEAREHTRHIEFQAQVLLRRLDDVKASRDARMEVVRTFLDEHRRLHDLFIHQNATGLVNLSVDHRVHLTQSRDEVLRRLRDLELAIGSLASSL